MADAQTLGVYDARVADYLNMTKREKIDPDLVRFMGYLPQKAYVLDLGCGPGTASSIMREHGFSVDPVDASREMVRLANEIHAIHARLATFEAINAVSLYDGIWANFSLLHAPSSEMPGHLDRLRKAIRHGGIVHLGMKLGEGERRDGLGRFYAYYSQDELTGLLAAACFEVFDFTLGEGGGLSGEVTPWITLIARAI